MQSHFYAILSRMKYIKRWGLMRNTREENLSEHSLEVSLIAHALAVISNTRLGNNIDANFVAVSALFHDTSEILTGDLHTPIKYHNPEIKVAYKKLEKIAEEELIKMLPPDMQGEFSKLYSPDETTAKFIKAADKLSALIKCIDERNMANKELKSAEDATLCALKELNMEEVSIFMNEFLESFSMTLDEQRQINNV